MDASIVFLFNIQKDFVLEKFLISRFVCFLASYPSPFLRPSQGVIALKKGSFLCKLPEKSIVTDSKTPP